MVPLGGPQLGVSVCCLSADATELTGGECGWWVDQPPLFTLRRTS